jgi:hypothetical protein
LDRGEKHEADALGLAAFECAVGLSLFDQREDDREGAVGGLVDRAGPLAVLAREHQLQQRCVATGEADVGRRGRPQSLLEVRARAIDRAAQLGAEAREPGFGEGVEQRLAVGEVPPWRAMADADLACKLTQRQVLSAALADRALGLREQRRAQVAMVVGALSHRARSLAEQVVVDIIVVIVYIVAYGYFEHDPHP